MKLADIFILFAVLLSGMSHAFAIAGELTTPAVAIPSRCSEAVRERMANILKHPDCKFLRGIFINRFTTLRYASDARALNLYLCELAHCPGLVLSVSFAKSLPQPGDWHVYHDPHRNRFHVGVNLASENVKTRRVGRADIPGHDSDEDSAENKKAAPT